MELEVFVHGAMCMSYSWRCLLWDYMNGRPWNKWECSHACRFKYKVWIEEERRPWKLFQIDEQEDWTHYILSSKDLCTIQRLWEILPYVDAMKIEGRSKSEFYVWAVVKAYKHVRDAILEWKQIDETIQNLVNIIPHREYWSGFLFNELANYPEWEWESFTTKTSPGPLFNRNYFWIIEDEYIEKDWIKYFKYSPKEVVEEGMILNYLSPDTSWELKIEELINEKGKTLEKGTCNTPNIYIKTNIELKWWELLYKNA
jgi:putative protease